MILRREAPNLTENAPEVSEQDIIGLTGKITQLLTDKADKKALEQIKVMAEKLSQALNELTSQLKTVQDYVRELENDQISAIQAKVDHLANQEKVADGLKIVLNDLKERIIKAEKTSNTNTLEVESEVSALVKDVNQIQEAIKKLQETIKNLGERTPTFIGGGSDHLEAEEELRAHEAAADPHTGYRLESADHTHQSTGAQAGQLDHGLALTGLTDDDHTQYQLESEKGQASGYASLSAGVKVVEDPANATATPTASKIPIADGSAKLDGWISSSSTTVPGLAEAATVAEVNTGIDAARAVTPDALAGSNLGTRYAPIVCVAFTTSVAVGDGQGYLPIPPGFNGMNLVYVHARVITEGTTNTTDIQIANVTDGVDMLSTKLTIDSAETGSDTAATPAVIDGTKDDVATNDLLRIDVDAISTTAPKGLIVTLGFQLP